MAINRVRLQHQAEEGSKTANRILSLLERPDRLIGLILIGNNFVNILASAIATVLAVRIFGDAGVAIATGVLTLVILIFAEVTPKTFAALHPERIARPASFILLPLLRITYPLVWTTNLLSNGLLRTSWDQSRKLPARSTDERGAAHINDAKRASNSSAAPRDVALNS